jgi:hypothetical protein
VRYQLTLDSGVNPLTGKRQQVRRRYATEKQARDALSEIGQQAATDQFVPRKAVTVEELCADWLASLHNARATTLSGYAYVLAAYVLAPLREQHGPLAAQKLTRPDLDRLLIALRAGRDDFSQSGSFEICCDTTRFGSCPTGQSGPSACCRDTNPGIDLRRSLGRGADVDVENLGRDVHR